MEELVSSEVDSMTLPGSEMALERLDRFCLKTDLGASAAIEVRCSLLVLRGKAD